MRYLILMLKSFLFEDLRIAQQDPLDITQLKALVVTVSKLKVYDKKNCTMVFMVNIHSHMYGEMISSVFEIFCQGNFKEIQP